VEVRLHHGTLSGEATMFWVLLTQRIVELGKRERDFSELFEIWTKKGEEQLAELQRRMESDTTEEWDRWVAVELLPRSKAIKAVSGPAPTMRVLEQF